MTGKKLQWPGFRLVDFTIALVLATVANAQGLAPGTRIPEFRLPDQNGANQTFETIRGPKGAMIVFYQSADWCTFCKSQLVELEQSLPDLEKRGLGLAAISCDSVSTLKHFAGRKSIHFPLLADENSAAIRAFGLLNQQVPATSEFFGIPHPVTYIVDRNGTVVSRVAETDIRQRFTVGSILGRKTGEAEVKARRIRITKSASDTVVHGGQRFKVRLDVELPPKNHVYAPGAEGYIPVDWQLKASDSFEALPMTYPPSRTLYLKAIKESAPIYEGSFTLEREIIPAQKLPAGDLRIEANFRYQVCDDRQCYVPETVPLTWTVRYEPHDTIRAPEELRRKRR